MFIARFKHVFGIITGNANLTGALTKKRSYVVDGG